ncbi:MAG: hypothetical protein AAFX05_01475 [Planctomycetota bacterium]
MSQHPNKIRITPESLEEFESASLGKRGVDWEDSDDQITDPNGSLRKILKSPETVKAIEDFFSETRNHNP